MTHEICKSPWTTSLRVGALFPIALSLSILMTEPVSAELRDYPLTDQSTEVSACMAIKERRSVNLHRCVCTLDVIAESLTYKEYQTLISAVGSKLTASTETLTLSAKTSSALRTTALPLLAKLSTALQKAKTECL